MIRYIVAVPIVTAPEGYLQKPIAPAYPGELHPTPYRKGTKNMTINKKTDGEKLVIEIEGRLDTSTSPQLESEIKSSLTGIKDLTVDITKLEYISSAGLRVLLSAQKAMNKQGNMTVKGANEAIMEIFEVTGFIDILNIE